MTHIYIPNTDVEVISEIVVRLISVSATIPTRVAVSI